MGFVVCPERNTVSGRPGDWLAERSFLCQRQTCRLVPQYAATAEHTITIPNADAASTLRKSDGVQRGRAEC